METCPTCGSLLPIEEIRTCGNCGAESPSLVARILYKSGVYQDVYLCDWRCVSAWLQEVTTDLAIVLPVLYLAQRQQFFDAMRVEQAGNKVGPE